MISLVDLRKKFALPGSGSEVVALDGISLEVPKGEIHGIVGRSGAGKSTLIRCLTGLDKPTSGQVSIDGTEISGLRDSQLRTARRSIGMVFQHVNLLDSRTAAQNIGHPLEVAGVSAKARRQRVAELVELVDLQGRENNYPSQLSGGQKQRVGIARALAADPAVLLCDEPSSALDSATTRQILALIRSLRDRLGITVLIITHEMGVVREICDSVTLLENGRIRESGPLLRQAVDPRGMLGRELIPLPPKPTGFDGVLVEVSFGGSETVHSARDVLSLVEAHGVRADIAAGTIETIAGTRVGRMQLELSAIEGSTISQSTMDTVLAALHDAGLGAEAA